MGERLLCKQEVVGSIPSASSLCVVFWRACVACVWPMACVVCVRVVCAQE